MKLTFANAWFATDQLVNSPSRFWNFTDRGSLQFESGILQFSGRKHSLQINAIESIDIISPRVPWLSIVVGIVASIVGLAFLLAWLHFESMVVILSFGIILPY